MGVKEARAPGAREPAAGRGWLAVVFLWAFAEAFLFFIIPDVPLSLLALGRLRRALLGCLLALAGAMLGGLLLVSWARADFPAADAAVEAVPAVSRERVDEAREAVRGGGAATFTREALVGSFTGRPYKIFALGAAAPGGELSLPGLLVGTAAARLPRFLLAVLLFWAAGRYLLRRWSPGRRRLAVLLFWILNYAWYWAITPG